MGPEGTVRCDCCEGYGKVVEYWCYGGVLNLSYVDCVSLVWTSKDGVHTVCVRQPDKTVIYIYFYASNVVE